MGICTIVDDKCKVVHDRIVNTGTPRTIMVSPKMDFIFTPKKLWFQGQEILAQMYGLFAESLRLDTGCSINR